jgi:dihydropyrimidinase
MADFDLLISGGRVVTPDVIADLDIGVKGETIAALLRPGAEAPMAGRTIDARGKIVTPGGIEPHAHIWEPMHRGWSEGKEVWLQRPEDATRAAVFGGTTTVLSFAFMTIHTPKQELDTALAVQDRREVFQGNSYADFAFHPVLTGTPAASTLASIPHTIEAGTPSFKFFTTDVTSAQSGVRINYGALREAMKVLSGHGGLALVHAEDDDLIKHLEASFKASGQDALPNVAHVHTPLGEQMAFQNVLAIADDTGAAVYFVHVTSAPGLETIAAARRARQPVYGEVLHNNLCFSLDYYDKPEGGRYHIGMGLRAPEHLQALWGGLASGDLSTLATDEYTTNLKVKLAGKTIETAAGGHVGIETRGMIGFSEGYSKGRVGLERFVRVFSTNAAQIMGLYPRKGAIAPGSDADIVLWDPDVHRTITMADLHHAGDYSPWEGWDVHGWPITTILRGKVVVDGGRLLGSPSDGRWLPRRIEPAMLRSPAL